MLFGLQILTDHQRRRRALAHGARRLLGAALAHVPRREYARQARLQHAVHGAEDENTGLRRLPLSPILSADWMTEEVAADEHRRSQRKTPL